MKTSADHQGRSYSIGAQVFRQVWRGAASKACFYINVNTRIKAEIERIFNSVFSDLEKMMRRFANYERRKVT